MRSHRYSLALLLCGLITTLPSAAASASSEPIGDSAIAESAKRITACREAATIKGEVKVDIMFVIDTSMSLRDSDPIGKTIRDPARVRAMQSVVSMLRPDTNSNVVADSGTSVRIRLNFLDFGSSVRSSFSPGGWQSIEDFDSKQISSFAAKDDDPDTDYVGALVDPGGIVETLRNATGESDCQIVLWFTDGKFDFDNKTGVGPRNFEWLKQETNDGVVLGRESAARARQVGERLLCNRGESRQNAVADELRVLDKGAALTVIGIGLNTNAVPGGFEILQRLLEGRDCGSLKPVGFMVEVTSADDLAGSMRRSLFPNVTVQVVCDATTITSGSSFYIAEPVKRADVFLRAREKVSEIQLVRLGRDNEVISSVPLMQNGAVRTDDVLPGIRVSTKQIDDAPTLETTLEFISPTEEWVGQWALRACSATGSGAAELDADVVIRGCVAFDLAAGDDNLVVGRSEKVFLVLKRCGSDASRMSTVQALAIGATVRVGDEMVKASLQSGEASIAIPFAPTEEDLKGAATRRIKLEVLEVDATYEVLRGTRPVVLEWSKEESVFDVTLRRPPSTPYVDRPVCDILRKKSVSVTCEFKATASDAVGRVYSDGPVISPDGALGDVKFTAKPSAAFPLTIQPKQPQQFMITFNVEGKRRNLENISQPFEISFTYETDGEPIEQVTIEGSFVVEPDFGIAPDWLRAIRFALLGLLVALGILSLVRFFFARIQVPDGGLIWIATLDLPRCDAETARTILLGSSVSAMALPVTTSSLGLRKIECVGPLAESGTSLEAKAGWRMISELGFVKVVSSAGQVVSSGGLLRRGSSGRASLKLVKEWWIVSSWRGDSAAKTKDELVTEIESAASKLVFVTNGAQSSRAVLEEIARSIEGGLSDQIKEVANRKWRPPAVGTSQELAEIPKVPEI